MINNRNTILSIIVLITSVPLFSMEMETYYKDTESDDEDEMPQTIPMEYQPIEQMIPNTVPIQNNDKSPLCSSYECCPKPYDNLECDDCRMWLSTVPVGSGVGVILGRSVPACICCCMGDSCSSACKETWIGDGSRCEEGFHWTLNGLIIISFVTAACAWAPWFDKDGCNVCKKKK